MFKCSIGDARFSRKRNLNRHYFALHEKTKPFNCFICSIVLFKQIPKTGDWTFACKYCDSKFESVPKPLLFNSDEQLQIHKTADRTFGCKCFDSKFEIVHEKKKSFKCSICHF